MRAHGIAAQIDGVAPARRLKIKKRVPILDAISASPGDKPEASSPQAILMFRPVSADTSAETVPQSEQFLDLVIDSAGKVRSATPVGQPSGDATLLYATREWRFIPCVRNDRPVACRARFSVSPRQ